MQTVIQEHPPEMTCRIVFLKISQNSQAITFIGVSFLLKVQALYNNINSNNSNNNNNNNNNNKNKNKNKNNNNNKFILEYPFYMKLALRLKEGPAGPATLLKKRL